MRSPAGSSSSPQIAVDPVTGTLVLSWRDGRDDAARARVATYITASIDGGNTFSAQTYANPQQTATDAITGKTVVMGPQADNDSSGNSNRDATYGFGSAMGLAVYDGQVYPIWAGNFNQGTVVNGAVQGTPLSIQFRPMVIAAGPRIVNSTMGPIAYPEAGGTISFTVTFDRPINPPGTTATFTAADVQVFYHDTTNGDASDPAPGAERHAGRLQRGRARQQVRLHPVHGHLQPNQSPTALQRHHQFTGTYSYLIAPDDGSGNPIEQPIRSCVIAPVAQPIVGPVASTNVPLPIPTSGTGGTGTSDDITTSTHLRSRATPTSSSPASRST